MKFNWQEILQENVAVHCPEEWMATELLTEARMLGYKWCSGESYIDGTHWEMYKENTVYDIFRGQFGSCSFYKYRDTVVYKFNDVLKEGSRRPKKEDTIPTTTASIRWFRINSVKIYKPKGKHVKAVQFEDTLDSYTDIKEFLKDTHMVSYMDGVLLLKRKDHEPSVIHKGIWIVKTDTEVLGYNDSSFRAMFEV